MHICDIKMTIKIYIIHLCMHVCLYDYWGHEKDPEELLNQKSFILLLLR